MWDRQTINRLVQLLTPAERAALERGLAAWLPTAPLWVPFPGPQLLAYTSPAYELFYGGAAGGGKSFLLLGLACTRHRKSLILRKEQTQLQELVEQSQDIIGARGSYNGSSKIWRVPDGGVERLVQLGGCKDEQSKEKFKGRSHDLKAFDEVSDFTESQYRFISAWTRTVVPNQRCRVVAAGNPPTTAEGEWVIRRWAPWLDRQHPRPARPGDLRWYAMVDGKEVECEGGAPFDFKGETITPRSRTFVPARVEDNPTLMATGYAATLELLPEPLRTMFRRGDFTVGREDDEWQVIPTAWVEAAMARWSPEGRGDQPLTAVGVDPSRGGRCRNVMVRRYGTWFDFPDRHPGRSVPDGPHSAGLVMKALAREGDGANAPVHVDVIGIGAAVYDALRQAGLSKVQKVNFGAATRKLDRHRVLHFLNVRAWAYWQLREALDPDMGEDLALPPDRELLADLTAVRWKPQGGKVKLEDKEEVEKRLGRSPDLADAFVNAALPPKGDWKLEVY